MYVHRRDDTQWPDDHVSGNSHAHGRPQLSAQLFAYPSAHAHADAQPNAATDSQSHGSTVRLCVAYGPSDTLPNKPSAVDPKPERARFFFQK